MPKDFVGYVSIEDCNTFWLSKGMAVYVVAASLPSMFTTFMAGAGRPVIGESITINYDASVESATLTGMRNETNA